MSAENTNRSSNALMLASVASMIDLFNTENIRILQQLGFKVDVAANFQEGSITSKERVATFRNELETQGIAVVDVPIPRSIFRIGGILRSYWMIRKLSQERHYGVVHCHSPIGGFVARLAFRKARKDGTRVIYTGHGLHFYKGAPLLNWVFFYPVERLCATITDVLIAINHEDYERESSWNTCKVEYVPGIGVDNAAFQNVKIDRSALRKELGFSDNDFVLMSTGQLSVRKNHEVIIRALAKAGEANIKYLIVGFGELENKLKQLVRKLGLEGHVVFAGYRGDVKQLLHVVDAFAFPSRQEGLPVALMEAMSVGLPVVCSKIRGNVDLIENGKGGLMYDVADVDGFAEGLLEIYRRRNSQIMGAINKETMKRFDKSVVSGYMERIYREQTELIE